MPSCDCHQRAWRLHKEEVRRFLAHRCGCTAEADDLLRQATESANAAHAVQTRLIEADQGEGKIPVTLVLVHAQDHLMTSMLARELVAELIELHEKVQ